MIFRDLAKNFDSDISFMFYGKNFTCNCAVIHEDVIKSVLKDVPDEELLFEVAEFFRIFGDSTRIGIFTSIETADIIL